MELIPIICTFVIILFGAVKAGEVVQFGRCDDSDDAVCEIKEVRVDPCKEASKAKPCVFKRGRNATIEFDFLPHFHADKLLGQAYSSTFIDLPLVGMERDACKSTTCPIEKDKGFTYTNTLFMSPHFPTFPYTVKWIVWNPDQEKDSCCFTIRIKLVK